jgi:tRNA-2-methylthio-N6-dimethylallyladenosine synthase
VAQVEDEARRMVARGVREITLLGQNVNAYAGEGPDGETWSLARLLHRLSHIEGLARLRYTTSHPRDMGEDLIAAHGDLEALMPYLHLPVQSGSDTILAAMNRQHTADDYRRLAEKIRAARPDIALSSDFIVGFPGESDRDFEATLQLVRDVNYASAFSFKYSSRPGTPAAAARKQIPNDVKDARLQALNNLLLEQQDAFKQSCAGRTLDVLFEKPGRQTGQAVGRSPYLQAVHVEGAAHLVGTIRRVTIDAVFPNSLKGSLLPSREKVLAH